MTTRTIKSLTSLCLSLPALMLVACGDEGGDMGSLDAVDNEHITLNEIEITGHNSPHLMHPIQVRVDAEVSAEAFETNINVALRSREANAGCVLGAMAIDPPRGEELPELEPGALTPWSAEAEFIINSSCTKLAGRDDLELFVAFDPWKELEGGSYIEAVDSDAHFDIFSAAAAAAVSVEGCESCEQSYALEDTPGLDAELLELNLSSVVAVLPVAADGGEEPISTSSRPDFSLTIGSRVTGLDRAQSLPEGVVQHTHSIRPLGSSDPGLPLYDKQGSRSFERGDIEVPGAAVVATVASLHIEGAAHEAIIDGAWSNIDEFELVTCLESEFEQAVFAGEDAPRDNDCAAIPVVIAREEVGQGGLPLPSGGDPSAATSGTTESYYDSWGANAGYGFGYSGVDFNAWLESRSTDGPTTTYGGIEVRGAGSWFEAGIRSEATVFDTNNLTIVDIYGTFIGYESIGGGVAMGATVFEYDFVTPFEIQLSDGVPLSLQEMFDAAGLDIDPTFVVSYPIAGVSFDDGCDDVGAGISIDTSIGIDTDLTTVGVSTTPQGVEVEGTFTPVFDVSVNAWASTGNFLGASAGISATLTLLNITLPFTVGVELITYEPHFDFSELIRLQFSESAGAWFNTLSGSIDFIFKYKDFWGSTITHDHTIASWSGFTDWMDFFSLTQSINTGLATNWCEQTGDPREMFAGDFDGDGIGDLLCHRSSDSYKWIDFGDDGYGGTNWHNGGASCNGNNDQIVIGDFNGDGRDDLFCRGGSGTHSIDYANNNGELYSFNWSTSSSWCTNNIIRAGDFDGDGTDDLLCYRPSDGFKWIDYASDGFGATDWSGYGAPEVLPDFISVGEVSLTSGWTTVNLPQSFTNPVVIAGPPSANGSDPVVVRVRNVGSNSFQIKVEEWEHEDGNHSTAEQVAWMVIEAGVNVDSEGNVWEAGTFLADGDLGVKTQRNFSNNFSSTPYVFASTQTYNGAQTISTRVDTLNSNSFQVLLQEEEAITDGHADETVGYLAISSAPSDTASHSIFLGSASVGDEWRSVNGIELAMIEETSLDSEIGHNNETVHVLGISSKYGGDALNFAQDVTFNGTDPAALRWR